MKLPAMLRRILRDSIRMYFAPLVGAVKGIRAEYLRVDRDIERNRQAEHKCR
jgi:hypothetical protein